jgi:hypothetical protein
MSERLSSTLGKTPCAQVPHEDEPDGGEAGVQASPVPSLFESA